MKKWIKRIGLGLLAIVIIALGGFYVYTLDYSKADAQAQEAFTDSIEQSKTIHAYLTNESDVGIIFYPGGKVEAKAYSVLGLELSEKGYSTFIVDMPFNLAVFDINAANRVRKLNPQIKTWFIAGHSLGGAMAFSHYDANSDEYAGLILLAAYPLKATSKPILILAGSNDKVLDASNLEGFQTTWIQGGNHAQFGNYGLQKGDGTPTISASEQRTITIESISNFILLNLNP